MNDICCIGHLTLDKIVTPRKTTYMPGGTSYYFSYGIQHLKDSKNYKLVTALTPSEYNTVEEMRKKGIQVEVLPSKHTVFFREYLRRKSGRTDAACACKSRPVHRRRTETRGRPDSSISEACWQMTFRWKW